MGTPLPPTPLQIYYIDPDGNNWNLNDRTMQNGYVCAGIAGIEGLPVSMQSIPLLDGTAVPSVYIPQPGSIALGLLVRRPESTGLEMDYYNLLDSVVRAFLTRRNELPAPGYLQVQRPDGTIRQIAVYTISGLNTPEVAVSNDTIYTITFQTPDPYWQDLNQQTLIYTSGVVQGILPLLPIQLTAGTIFGNSVIYNSGSAMAWPIWTLTGPGTPTMTNVTTGRHWSLNTPILAGQVVQVTTKPGTQFAYNITLGVNIWDQLVLSSLRDLWPIIGGTNQVTISMAGSSSATSVQINWVNRWNRA